MKQKLAVDNEDRGCDKGEDEEPGIAAIPQRDQLKFSRWRRGCQSDGQSLGALDVILLHALSIEVIRQGALRFFAHAFVPKRPLATMTFSPCCV